MLRNEINEVSRSKKRENNKREDDLGHGRNVVLRKEKLDIIANLDTWSCLPVFVRFYPPVSNKNYTL